MDEEGQTSTFIFVEILGTMTGKQENHHREDLFYIYRTKEDTPVESDGGKVPDTNDIIYLVTPFQSHFPDTEEKEGYVIAFSKHLLSLEEKKFYLTTLRLFNLQYRRDKLSIDLEFADEIDAIVQVLKKETDKKEPNLSLVRTILKAVLLKLIAYKDACVTATDSKYKIIEELLLLLQQHFLKEKELAFYADKLEVPPKRLDQLLKKQLGKPIKELIHEHLLIEAKHQLYDTRKNMRRIASTLNFTDKSEFSKFFQELTGTSPEKYRKQAKDLLSKKRVSLF